MAIHYEAEIQEENGVQVTRVKLDTPYTFGLIRQLKEAGLTFSVTFNAGEHEGDSYDSFFIEGGEGMVIAGRYQPTL